MVIAVVVSSMPTDVVVDVWVTVIPITFSKVVLGAALGVSQHPN